MQEITMQTSKAFHAARGVMGTENALQDDTLRRAIKAYLDNTVELNEGEHYAGIVLGKDGTPNYHLILLPGEAEKIKWKAAKDWATEQGGELPTRREQALLYTNLKEQFQPRWYWSSETHPTDAPSAFIQSFYDGYQYYPHKDYEYCARAVRRVSVI